MDKTAAINASRRPEHSAQAGFTLVEMLISIAIMGAILALLAGGIRVLASGWEGRSERLAEQDMIMRALDVLRQDIEGQQRLVWAQAQPPRFIFEGRKDSLLLIVNEPPYPTAPGLFLVAYSVERSGNAARLLRTRHPFHSDLTEFPANAAAEEPVPLFEGKYRYRFAFARAGTDPLQWQDDWPHANQLPGLIRIETRHADTNALLFAPYTVRLRIDAEHGCAVRAAALCTLGSDGVLPEPKPGSVPEKARRS